VPRTPFVPPSLTSGPFTLADARRSGLRRWHLEGSSWRRLGSGVYVWAALPDGPLLRLEAARRRLPPGAAFSGLTAAWLHGLDVEPCDPIEATVPKSVCASNRSGMAIRHAALDAADIVTVRGMPATSIGRTLADLRRRLSLTELVVLVDMALHKRAADLTSLSRWTALRRAVGHAEAATESPMETRLRMLLVLGGLPRPQVQVPLHDARGRLLGRPDLYYPTTRLGIEYDGASHRNSLASDNRRQNRLLSAGITLLRFTANDVYDNPRSVVAQVKAMLT
jgi:very-short-patch-repair endonuclease